MILKHAFAVAALATATVTATGLAALPAAAETAATPATAPKVVAKVAGVSFGPYMRLEMGVARRNLSDAHWLPPGYPSDPRVDFDLGSDDGSLAGIAVGYDWMNGFRVDGELLYRGGMDLAGPSTTAGDATITGGRVTTTALMANLYYSPFEHRGSSATIQPFVTVGLGVANNDVGSWTRTNPTATHPVRTFSGDTTLSLAAAIGFGVSMQISRVAGRPVFLEAAYKYYYFGTARGGSTPIAGGGSSEPVDPLNFTPEDQVISLSVRIPLQRL